MSAVLGTKLQQHLRAGTVIPAMPLAQDEEGVFDERYQRALIRYYLDSGAGGLAVGVHTTQFNIRSPGIDLFERVLEFSSTTISDWKDAERPFLKIAGITGPTPQAIAEAKSASSHGYDIGLVSLAALQDSSTDDLISHCSEIASILPVMGFYLQPAVGGRPLSYDFWYKFAQIENVVAIKISPFNRYQTLDVVRAVAAAGCLEKIALYTGNDDNIVADLLTPFVVDGPDGKVEARIVGGLLGHWAVWTRRAVAIFEDLQKSKKNSATIPADLLSLGVEITDANAALFDAANNFSGCLPGIHEVLRRQGLRKSVRCLDADEVMSSTQSAELNRIYAQYPHLTDDEFVSGNLQRWLEED